MGFLDSVKNSANRAKLKGEMALLDREINNLNSKFGVELYDKLTQQQQATNKGNILNLMEFLPSSNANQKAVQEPLEACRADVTAKQMQIDAKRLEIEKLQCDRERFRGHSGTIEKMKHDTTSRSEEAKLHVQIKLLEREIHQRKEEFGRTVFDALADSNDSERSANAARGGGGGGILGKLKPENKNQKEIATLIERAQRPVALAREKKSTAERELAELNSTT